MEEIARRPGPGGPTEMGTGVNSGCAVAQEREGYALAAGLAVGLITLGRGHNTVGIADLQLPDRLRWDPALLHKPSNF
jgi:hypothetical protein